VLLNNKTMSAILTAILFLFLFQTAFAQFPVNPAKMNGGKPRDTTRIRVCAPSRGTLIQQPLYVILLHDKAIFRSDTSKINVLGAINPQDINKIDILKDSTAVSKYGRAAKNGVIFVTLKNERYPGVYKLLKSDSVKTQPKNK
jgi:TonB-dependent SusC/RagA subfamily outer membrane receptor